MRTWKLVFSVLAMSFCGVANGQSCGGDEIYNETFYIDKQIDSVRYVDRVVARDNEEGDFILDFMVERSDTSTRERWMVTYVCDASYHMVQEVRVAGALQSTLRLAGALSTPRVSLFSPTTGLDPEVQADVPCEDVDLPSLRANIALTSIARLVALEVTTAVVDQNACSTNATTTGACWLRSVRRGVSYASGVVHTATDGLPSEGHLRPRSLRTVDLPSYVQLQPPLPSVYSAASPTVPRPGAMVPDSLL
ncbi:MAG: hypothetical protein L0Y44_00400 [Phycisphaerales bacterium]|nr:hypothetical protein [Phycisphaerales bacterium]MCI0629096.1 hypothetical protein [Phycisphaerales bacterium]